MSPQVLFSVEEHGCHPGLNLANSFHCFGVQCAFPMVPHVNNSSILKSNLIMLSETLLHKQEAQFLFC